MLFCVCASKAAKRRVISTGKPLSAGLNDCAMKPEQRAMNNETYRKCFDVCDEVKAARAGKKIRLRDYPAAIVMCKDSWENPSAIAIEKSGKVVRNTYQETPQLEQALGNLGTIGGKRDECKNYIGACAEPHSAKAVMQEQPEADVSDLAFSCAYRPRTKTVIRYCKNCTDVFNVQNP